MTAPVKSKSHLTNGSGQAVFTNSGCVKKPAWQFCVDDVTDTLTYDDTDNVITCDSM